MKIVPHTFALGRLLQFWRQKAEGSVFHLLPDRCTTNKLVGLINHHTNEGLNPVDAGCE